MKGILTLLVLIIIFSVNVAFAQFQLSSQDLGSYVTVGIAWGDYDNDGDEDLFLSNGDQMGNAWENFLFNSNGDGTFTQVSGAGTIITDVFTSAGCCWGDYDNDGDLDLAVAEGKIVEGSAKLSLYINNGDGSFSNASAGPITATVSYSRIDPAWADGNNDGWIDMALSNAPLFGPSREHSYYVNDQDGTFSEISNNLTDGTSAKGSIAWADADNDGDMDIVTTSGGVGQQTVLWVNTGSNFTESVLVNSGAGVGKNTQGVSWGDYDNDGDMDLYLANYGDGGAEVNTLFRNDGLSGGIPVMTEMDGSSGVGDLVTDVDLSIASTWGDVDNDGDLDLFVGNDGELPTNRSRLYINNNGVFSSQTSGDLIDNANYIRSAAFADVEQDGDLDLVVGRDGFNRLFINELSNGNNWALFHLTGTNANRAAIGAQVKVLATISGQSVWQMREVSSHSGTCSQNSYWLHFGLGDANVINSVIVKWPGSDLEQELSNLTINQVHFISEVENQKPVAIDDDTTTAEDTALSIDVLNNDYDNDGDDLVIHEVLSAQHGSVTNNVSDVFYIPEQDFFGQDSFNYVISDGNGGLDTAMVYLDVNSKNDAPQIQNLPDTVIVEQEKSVDLGMEQYAYDVDTDYSLLTWDFTESSSEISASYDNGTDILTITAGLALDTFFVYVSLTDDSSASELDTIMVPIVEPNAIDNLNIKIPNKYALKQNYPNPFNPSTMIEYQLPELSQVDLGIYNLLGQKVATLVSEKQMAGNYKIEWDASGFTSGVYLYQINTDKGFTATKKLVLLR